MTNNSNHSQRTGLQYVRVKTLMNSRAFYKTTQLMKSSTSYLEKFDSASNTICSFLLLFKNEYFLA